MSRDSAWLPSVVAALTNALIAYTIITYQPYPLAAIIALGVMQLAALLAAVPSRIAAALSLCLFLAGGIFMLSFWFYWVPTLITIALVFSRRATDQIAKEA